MADTLISLFNPFLDEDDGDVSTPAHAVVSDGTPAGYAASETIFAQKPATTGMWVNVPGPAAAANPVATTPAASGSGDMAAMISPSGNPLVDASLSGVKWADGAITYSDPDASGDYQLGYVVDQNGDRISAQNQGFSQLTAQQMLAVHFALNDSIHTQPVGAAGFSAAGFTNLDIDYAGAGVGTGAIRIANSADPPTAYAFYPGTFAAAGDAWLGPSVRSPVAGNYAWFAVLHELGHTLGLKHGHEDFGFNALPAEVNSLEFTLMTYLTYVGQSPVGRLTFEQWSAPQTYMMLDIAALQYMYGADYTINSTDTAYTWSPASGETFVNGNLAIDPGGNRIFATIWDGGGIDTYDLSNYATGVTVDLGPGDYSVFSTAQLANLGGGPNGGLARGNIFNALNWYGDTRSLVENAVGGSGADVLRGNTVGNLLMGNAGDDVLFGEDGNDVLDGGAGVDSLVGDAGEDTLVYDLADARIDGGNGTDTLQVAGSGVRIDLTSLTDDVITNVEIIDLGGRGNGLLLELSDALALSSATDTVRIDGGVGDRVGTADTQSWVRGGDQAIGSEVYRAYTQAAATLLIDSDIAIDISVILPPVITSPGDSESAVVGGKAGANFIIGNATASSLTGSGGADTILGGAGDDWIEGETGNNPLPSGETAGADIISGGAGNDTILAGGADDLVHGDAGNDTIIGEAGDDVIYGDEGYDAIDGGDGGDVLYGGSEADILFGAADSDTLYGGEGNDIIMGERNQDNALGVLDILHGEGGNDLMHGGGGDDWIFGGNGVDVIDGSFGSDLIVAGPGGDIMLGSGASEYAPARAGNDLFVYTGMVDAGDQIWGFDTRPGDTDSIDLRALFDNIGYSGLTPRLDGILSVSQGATPTDTVIAIDPNGGGDSFSVLVTLHGVTPAGVTDAFFLFQ